MVRITKISAGILLLILSIILMIKTGFQGFISALIGNGAIGSAAGIVLAITFIVSAIVYILTNRTYSLVPDIIGFVIIILGAAMGIYNANLPDTAYLNIWSWIGIVIGAIVLITSIVDLIINPIPDDDEQYDSQNRNDNYMRNQRINYDQFQQQQYTNNGYQNNIPYSGRNDQQAPTRSRLNHAANQSAPTQQYPNSSYQGNSYNNQIDNNPYQNNGNWNQYNGDQQNGAYANNQQQRNYGRSENGYQNKNLNNSSENNYDGNIRYDPAKSRRSRH